MTTINSDDLNFALTNRLFIISCPAAGVELHCDLNETGDRIIGSWIVGNDGPEAGHIAGLMVAAGNAHLENMKVVHGPDERRGCEGLELMNYTPVFEAFDYEENWRGTGTLEAIKAAGCRADLASWMYAPKEFLTDGWVFVEPTPRR
jgi:hypothetical protein